MRSPGRLKEQSEKTLDAMKRQFVNLLRYSDPLDTMRKTSGPGRRKLGKGKVRKHNGIDFGVKVGNPVYAPFSGRVVKIVDNVDRAYRPSKVKFCRSFVSLFDS